LVFSLLNYQDDARPHKHKIQGVDCSVGWPDVFFIFICCMKALSKTLHNDSVNGRLLLKWTWRNRSWGCVKTNGEANFSQETQIRMVAHAHTHTHTHNGNLRPKIPTKNNNPEENPEDVEHTNPQTTHPQPILKTTDNTTYYHGPHTIPPQYQTKKLTSYQWLTIRHPTK